MKYIDIFIHLFTFVLYTRVFLGTQRSRVRSKHTPTGQTPSIFINMQIIDYDYEKSDHRPTHGRMWKTQNTDRYSTIEVTQPVLSSSAR